MLHALRLAIPASLDDRSEVQRGFSQHEAALIAQANGQSAAPEKSARRWSYSKPAGVTPAKAAAHRAS